MVLSAAMLHAQHQDKPGCTVWSKHVLSSSHSQSCGHSMQQQESLSMLAVNNQAC